jgi:hypothetical protein
MKEAGAMEEGRQRLTAKRKLQVYLETRAPVKEDGDQEDGDVVYHVYLLE